MRNKEVNNEVFNLRNQIAESVESVKFMLSSEKNKMEAYKEGELELDENGRNRRGEYVNFESMERNIESLQDTLKNLQDALSSLSITASIYK